MVSCMWNFCDRFVVGINVMVCFRSMNCFSSSLGHSCPSLLTVHNNFALLTIYRSAKVNPFDSGSVKTLLKIYLL